MNHRPYLSALRARAWLLAVMLGALAAAPVLADDAQICQAVRKQCDVAKANAESAGKGKEAPLWTTLGSTESTASGSAATGAKALALRGLDGERINAVSLGCNAATEELLRPQTLVSVRLTVIDNLHYACEWPRRAGGLITARVAAVDKDQEWLLLRPAPGESPSTQTETGQRPTMLSLKVLESGLKPAVKKLETGDQLEVVFREDGSVPSLVQFDWASREIGQVGAAWWLAVALLLVACCAWLFTWAHPTQLFLGEDGRYSTSKFQAAMWFWLVFAGYLASIIQRAWYAGLDFVAGIAIPQNLVLLSGISVLTVAGAKAITSGKVEVAQTQTPPSVPPGSTAPRQIPKYPSTTASLGDLIRDDFKRVDLGDFQSVLVTLIAVGVYGLTLVRHLSLVEFRQQVALPELDATLLALFGLSQGGYLGKKAAGDVGAGMTPQQAVARAAELATSVKLAADRAVQANTDAGSQRQQAAAALSRAIGAATQTPAKTAQAEASAAALATQGAADRCTKAQQQGQAAFDEIKKLAANWRSEPAAQPATQQALDEATRQQSRSDGAAMATQALANAAQADADAALTAAQNKPLL